MAQGADVYKPFQGSPDQTDNLANQGNQVIDFFHVPTGNSVKFKAFLTQFDDVYSSEWNSENAYGRMDPIQSFQRTGRKISIGFDVVAGSFHEAQDNLGRITGLIQMLYPSYDGGAGATSIQAAPYFKLNFMNLASNTMSDGTSGAESSGLLGTVDGLTYSPNIDVGFYHNLGALYPKVVNISCTFTVLHQNQLGWIQDNPRSGFDDFPYQATVVGNGEDLYGFFEMPSTSREMKLDYADEDMAMAAAEILTAPPGGYNASIPQANSPAPGSQPRKTDAEMEKLVAKRNEYIANLKPVW